MEIHISTESTFGSLAIGIEDNAVVLIKAVTRNTNQKNTPDDPLAAKVAEELHEYFMGRRKKFTIPLKMNGTAFQVRVWNELMNIPYGSIATYGEIATLIGKPGAARAVGMACNHNPLLIVVPCHRVVGKDGNLTGYVAGVERKRMLLELERYTNEMMAL